MNVAAAHFARKVDQQLAFCEQLLSCATASVSAAALINALSLQIERALCLYLLELARAAGNKSWSHQWILNREMLNQFASALFTSDAQELQALLQEASWLSSLIDHLASMRDMEDTGSLKAEIFQSDSNGALLIASSRRSLNLDMPGINTAVSAFKALLQRQRAGHSEY